MGRQVMYTKPVSTPFIGTVLLTIAAGTIFWVTLIYAMYRLIQAM